jgi:hypothetical protein
MNTEIVSWWVVGRFAAEVSRLSCHGVVSRYREHTGRKASINAGSMGESPTRLSIAIKASLTLSYEKRSEGSTETIPFLKAARSISL